jgi:PhzF family phenazine biosynthesis protein
MSMKLFTVDAFTNRPFTGNPAAVVPLESPLDPHRMQLIAAEMNLSETAFVHRLHHDRFSLRWFTPQVEVDLCGHATLATAHILWQTGQLAPDATAHFETRSGTLTARRLAEDWIELDFPAQLVTPLPLDPHLEKILGHRPIAMAKGGDDLIVELSTPKILRSLHPDFAAIARLPYRGLVVTSISDDSHYDFISRFFAPAVGINEDPVTGSAHCALAPYWSAKFNKTDMLAHQSSPRGGTMRVQLQGPRVKLAGQAVTIYDATLHV